MRTEFQSLNVPARKTFCASGALQEMIVVTLVSFVCSFMASVLAVVRDEIGWLFRSLVLIHIIDAADDIGRVSESSRAMGTAKVYVLPVQRDTMERIIEIFSANGTNQDGACGADGVNIVRRMELEVSIRNEGELRVLDGSESFPDPKTSAAAGLENLQFSGRKRQMFARTDVENPLAHAEDGIPGINLTSRTLGVLKLDAQCHGFSPLFL